MFSKILRAIANFINAPVPEPLEGNARPHPIRPEPVILPDAYAQQGRSEPSPAVTSAEDPAVADLTEDDVETGEIASDEDPAHGQQITDDAVAADVPDMPETAVNHDEAQAAADASAEVPAADDVADPVPAAVKTERKPRIAPSEQDLVAALNANEGVVARQGKDGLVSVLVSGNEIACASIVAAGARANGATSTGKMRFVFDKVPGKRIINSISKGF